MTKQESNKYYKHIPKLFWEFDSESKQVIQGGSNHALDIILESEMQNKRKIKRLGFNNIIMTLLNKIRITNNT
jgi:hypothetical protein